MHKETEDPLSDLTPREWSWAIWIIRLVYWRCRLRRFLRRAFYIPRWAAATHAVILWAYVSLTGITPEYGIFAVAAVWGASLATLVAAWSIVIVGERILA